MYINMHSVLACYSAVWQKVQRVKVVLSSKTEAEYGAEHTQRKQRGRRKDLEWASGVLELG